MVNTSRIKPKVKLGLLGSLLCLLGFFLITLSLYSSIQKYQQQKKQPTIYNIGYTNHNFELDSDGNLPNITIFSAFRPFSTNVYDSIGARQELAVRSWLGLSLNVQIVLFGQHPSVHKFASNFGNRVVVESDIDFAFSGTPFFHSMVARSQSSYLGISILLDSETILLPDIISILQNVHRLNCDWFLISLSPSIADFPFILDDTGKHWLQKDRRKIKNKKLQEFLNQNRQWKNCGEKLLMAWNTGDLPLHAGVLPPFLYGKGLHNNWLLNEVVLSDFRFVIDASLAASSFHIENSGSQLNEIWEYQGNHHLASLYGSLYFQPNNASPVRLVKCAGKYLLLDLGRSTFYSPHGLKPSPRQEKKWINCMEAVRSLERKSPCSEWHKVFLKTPMPLNFSLSLKSLLKTIADKDKSVVLAVAGDNYRDMLMNWVCRLRNLAVTNFLVCALDPDIYQFSVLQRPSIDQGD